MLFLNEQHSIAPVAASGFSLEGYGPVTLSACFFDSLFLAVLDKHDEKSKIDIIC